MLQVGGGPVGGGREVAVGLGDDEQLGQLHHAALHPLEVVAGARPGQEAEQVDHLGDRRLGLADAHGLDQHRVVAGGLAQQHGLASATGDAAEGAPGGGGADEGLGSARQLLHPGLVAEDGAAGSTRRRIDREHRQRVALVDHVAAEGVDERRLADAGRARDAEPHAGARVGQDGVEELDRLGAVVGPGRLDEGDRPPERAAVAGEEVVGEGHPWRRSRTVPAASRMLVPGPNTAETPASRRKS